MLPELKAQWVEALRSGKYQQGQSELRAEGPSSFSLYCCLGVLCDVLGREWHQRDDGGYYLLDLDDDNEEELDQSHWQDIVPPRLRQSIVLPENAMHELVQMNDDEGASFDEIANWIDYNL